METAVANAATQALTALGVGEVIVGLVVAALLGWIRKLYKRMKRDEEKTMAVEKGIVSLLRDRIVQAYHYHYETKGCMSIHSRDAVDAMYRQYAALDGNGTIASLVERLNSLPTENRKDDV